MVLVADISFVSYLDTESLTDAARQAAGFVWILAQIDGVHTNILRVNLEQQNQLLQLPGGRGRQLKETKSGDV